MKRLTSKHLQRMEKIYLDLWSTLDGLSVSSIVVGIVLIGAIGLQIASLWRLFEKAGYKGWAALIPGYNLLLIMRLMNHSWVGLLLLLLPLVNLILPLYWTARLAQCYSFSPVVPILAILFPYVVFPVLAFSKARYTYPYDW